MIIHHRPKNVSRCFFVLSSSTHTIIFNKVGAYNYVDGSFRRYCCHLHNRLVIY